MDAYFFFRVPICGRCGFDWCLLDQKEQKTEKRIRMKVKKANEMIVTVMDSNLFDWLNDSFHDFRFGSLC